MCVSRMVETCALLGSMDDEDMELQLVEAQSNRGQRSLEASGACNHTFSDIDRARKKKKNATGCPAELPLGRNKSEKKKKEEENKILLSIFVYLKKNLLYPGMFSFFFLG